MATHKSTLIFSLIDGISAPGRKAEEALHRLGISAHNAEHLLGALGIAWGAVETVKFVKEGVAAYAAQEKLMGRIQRLGKITKDEMKHGTEEVEELAVKTGHKTEELLKTQLRLLQQNKTYAETMEMLPDIAKTASGDNAEKLGNVVAQMQRDLHLSKEDTKLFYGIISQAAGIMPEGEESMGRLLDSVTKASPFFERMGPTWQGPQGMAKLAAYTKVAADGMGGTANAAEAVEELMGKMYKGATQERFLKAGINLWRRLKEGMKRGEDPFTIYLQAIDEAMAKGYDVLGKGTAGEKFIQEMRKRGFEVKKIRNELMAGAPTAVAKGFDARAQELDFKIKQLTEAWEQFKSSVAGVVVDLGLGKGLDRLRELVGDISTMLADIRKAEEQHDAKKKKDLEVKAVQNVLDYTPEWMKDVGPKMPGWWPDQNKAPTYFDLPAWLDKQSGGNYWQRVLGRKDETAESFEEPGWREQMDQNKMFPPGFDPEEVMRIIDEAIAKGTKVHPYTPELDYIGPRPGPETKSPIFSAEFNAPPILRPFLQDELPWGKQMALAGQEAGKAFSDALSSQLDAAENMIMERVNRMQNILGFKSRPKVSPLIEAPSTGPNSQGPGSLTDSLLRSSHSDAQTVPVQ